MAPDVFHELGAAVVAIGCSPDGTNINAGFGATAPAALIAEVKASGADFGVALDGDADRLQLVDHSAAGSTAAMNCSTCSSAIGSRSARRFPGRLEP